MINPYKFFTVSVILFSVFFLFIILTYTKLSWLLALFLALNTSAFIAIGYDKKIAGTGDMRIPEKVFYGICAAGGSLGVLLAMSYFRHKTKKTSFQFVVGLIALAQLLLLLSYYAKFLSTSP